MKNGWDGDRAPKENSTLCTLKHGNRMSERLRVCVNYELTLTHFLRRNAIQLELKLNPAAIANPKVSYNEFRWNGFPTSIDVLRE